MFAPFFVLFGLMAVGYLCRKFDSIDDVKNDGLGSMVQLSMLTSNNGFMGFPITMAFFGQQGLFLMVANNLAMGIVVWSYGLFILKRTKRIFEGDENVEKSSVSESLRQIFNNTVVAIFIGLAIGIAGINS